MLSHVIIVQTLYRYPIKGLSPERVAKVTVHPGKVFPGDPQFAFTRSSGLFNPARPTYLAKTNFLMLQRDERLVAVTTRFDFNTQTLSIEHEGGAVESDLSTQMGRRAAEECMADYFVTGSGVRSHVAVSLGHSFSDLDANVISLVNLASVQDLSRTVGTDLDPLRFRADVYFTGLEAWREINWVGQTIKLGSSQPEVVQRSQRCAATNVNLATATRDQNLPKPHIDSHGYSDLGIYARVVTGGAIGPGDEIAVLV